MTTSSAVGPADSPVPVATPAGDDESGPFPGLASYDYDRRGSFLGRDTETQHLATMILSRRLIVLTAGSGDGKTSLIHAGLAPALLTDRIEVAVAEPGLNEDQPFEAIGSLYLDRLLPQPAEVAELLARLIGHFSAEATLRAVRTCCTGASPQQCQVWLNGEVASRPTSTLKGGPLVCWLRDDRLCDEYVEAAMRACLPGSWPGLDAPLGELRAAVPVSATAARTALPMEVGKAREQLLADLGAAVEKRQATDPGFEAVLILDQFEEVFVRLSGPDAGDKREAVLLFVLELLQRPWPVRLVLSLRKEHYADLQTAFGDRLALEPSTYHLQPLSLEQAERCLTGQEWGEEAPAPGLAKSIVSSISYENRCVNPTLLSVAGQHLWRSRKGGQAEDDAGDFVPRALETFVSRIIEGKLESELARHEAFDMFDQLTLRDGIGARRASIERSTLVAAPLRDAPLRKDILEKLKLSRLVREEERLRSAYVEVVHESLLPIIQKLAQQLRNSMPLCADFPALIDDIRTEVREQAIHVRPVPRRLYPVLLDNIGRLRPPPHLAARTLGRLLFDSNLRELAGDGEHRPQSPAADGSPSPPQASARLRELYRKLDEAAAGALTGEAASQRLADSDLMLPGEADRLLGATGTPPDLASIRLAVASSLTHRDGRAHARIRRLGGMLRQLEQG